MNKQDDLAVAVNVTNDKLDELRDKADVIPDKLSNVERGMNARFELLIEKYEEEKRKHEEQMKELRDRESYTIGQCPPIKCASYGIMLTYECFLDKLAIEKERNTYLVGAIRGVSPLLDSRFHNRPMAATQVFPSWVWCLEHVYDVDIHDLQAIKENRHILSLRDRAQTGAIVDTTTFNDWMTTIKSARLLIQGSFMSPTLHTSALSLFCTTFVESLRARCMCLVWFCGRYVDRNEGGGDLYNLEDDSDDGFLGDEDYDDNMRVAPIRAMLRSLIAQLFLEYDFGSLDNLPPNIDMLLVEQGNIEQLTLFFVWLIHRLPRSATLFIVIDSIAFYEREEFEDPMLDAFGLILGLAGEGQRNTSVTIKVLMTSPWQSSTIRLAFESEQENYERESWILSMQALPIMHVTPSDERIVRELGRPGEDFEY